MARVIPNYALYGDQALPGWQSILDFEWIPQRSMPYNWEIQPHTHEAFIQILLLTEGGVEARIDHTSVQVRAPCVLVIPAQTVHGFNFSPDTDGPVVTAAQRPLESLADVLMPELILDRSWQGGPVSGLLVVRFGPAGREIGRVRLTNRSGDVAGLMDTAVRESDKLYVAALRAGNLLPDPSLIEPDVPATALEDTGPEIGGGFEEGIEKRRDQRGIAEKRYGHDRLRPVVPAGTAGGRCEKFQPVHKVTQTPPPLIVPMQHDNL